MIGVAKAGEAYGSFQSKVSMGCHEEGRVGGGGGVIEMDVM